MKTKAWLYTAAAAVLAGAAVPSARADGDSTRGNSRLRRVERAADASLEALPALMADLADYHACRYMTNTILALSAQGARLTGGKEPDTGVLWIRQCRTSQPAPDELRVELEAIGWRWADRETEAAGATFTLDQNVKFRVSVSTAGVFDAAYSREQHTLSLYFVPTEPVEASFELTGRLDIDNESLWASIVGIGADIIGKAPAGRAREAVKQTVKRILRSEIDRGFTLLVDLCTSQTYARIGAYQGQEVPESAIPLTGTIFAVNATGVLHRHGLLMAGPFERDRRFHATFQNTSRESFEAAWLCLADARALAERYVQGEGVAGYDALKTVVVEPGQDVEFAPPYDPACPLVLMMQPASGARPPVRFKYAVIYDDRRQRELVECGD